MTLPSKPLRAACVGALCAALGSISFLGAAVATPAAAPDKVWAELDSSAPATLHSRFGCLLSSDIDVTKPSTRLSLRVAGKAAVPTARRLVRHANGQAVTTVEVVAPRYGPAAMLRVSRQVRRALQAYPLRAYVFTFSPGEIVAAYRRSGRCPRVSVNVVQGSSDALAAARSAQRRLGKDRVGVSVLPPDAVVPVG